MTRALAIAASVAIGVVACSSSDGASTPPSVDGGSPGIDLGGPASSDAGSTKTPAIPSDAGTGEAGGDAAAFAATGPYVSSVVSFTPGRCAGFGSDQMPTIVLGPPQGAGNGKGSLDVVSLGLGGTIVLALEPIVDGPGVDFIVYENAFFVNGDTSTDPYTEPGEVSVSDDGTTWYTFPCTATAPPWGMCAGWHAVQPAATRSLDAGNGGDPFDLADVGIQHARFVRIVDKTQSEACSSQGPNTDGFDLDAIGVVNSE